jgi:hypothetical protein
VRRAIIDLMQSKFFFDYRIEWAFELIMISVTLVLCTGNTDLVCLKERTYAQDLQLNSRYQFCIDCTPINFALIWMYLA